MVAPHPEHGTGGGGVQALQTLLEVMVTLTRTDLKEAEYDPSDGKERLHGLLDPEIGCKGLGVGVVGCVPVHESIWSKYAPAALEWALSVLPDQEWYKGPGLQATVDKMVEDGLLGLGTAPCKSQFKACVKQNNAAEGALIVDPQRLNSLLLPTAFVVDFTLCL